MMTPQEAAHFQVLRIIEQNPAVTQRKIAELMGLSVGKTNYLMKALVAKGAIKINSFKRSDTKLKKIAYLLTPAGISLRVRLTQNYLTRMEVQYEALKTEIEALKHESFDPDATQNKKDSSGFRVGHGSRI